MKKEIINEMIADWKILLKKFKKSGNFLSARLCQKNIVKLEKELKR